MSEASDEALLSSYQAGDVRAFETLLGRYRGPLFNFLLRSSRDRGCAEELYQEVWMKVIERCDDFRGDAKFSTWLYTIARNLSIDHQRRMKFRGHVSLEVSRPESGLPMGERVSNPGPTTEQLAMGGLVRDRIAAAVEALPAEQREVFLLRQLQGLAFREIGEVVGIPANTVKSRMRYALERLQHVLSDLKESDEV